MTNQMVEQPDMIKVRFKLNPESWHGTSDEGVWAKLIKPLVGRAIVSIENIPFFTKSVSYKDTISIVLAGSEIVFDAIVERGGHSTYRVFIEQPELFDVKKLQDIKNAGCEWEKANLNGGDLYAIDVPPTSNIYKVYKLLEKGKSHGLWLFDEGYVGHALKDDSDSISHF